MNVDVGTPNGLRRADEAERLIAENGVERTEIFDLYQDEPNRATVEILYGSACELHVLTLAFSRVVIEWDAYAGSAWYLERRPGV